MTALNYILFEDMPLDRKIRHFWKQFLDYVQNNNNNCGILKLIKKERLKKEIFNFVETSNKDLVMQNYNIFRALVFQKIIFPELEEKRRFLKRNDIDLSTLLEALNDENLFRVAQKRFGFKMADPKDLKKKAQFIFPVKQKSGNVGFKAKKHKFSQLKKTLTKNFGFSFDEDEEKPKITESIVENSYKPSEYLRMTSMKKQISNDMTRQLKTSMNMHSESIIYSENAGTSQEGGSVRGENALEADEDPKPLFDSFFNKKCKVSKPKVRKVVSKASSNSNYFQMSQSSAHSPVRSPRSPANSNPKTHKTLKSPRLKKFKCKPPELANCTISECLNILKKKIDQKSQNYLHGQRAGTSQNFRSVSPIKGHFILPTCASKLRNMGFEGAPRNLRMESRIKSVSPKPQSPVRPKNIHEKLFLKKLMQKNMAIL